MQQDAKRAQRKKVGSTVRGSASLGASESGNRVGSSSIYCLGPPKRVRDCATLTYAIHFFHVQDKRDPRRAGDRPTPPSPKAASSDQVQRSVKPSTGAQGNWAPPLPPANPLFVNPPPPTAAKTAQGPPLPPVAGGAYNAAQTTLAGQVGHVRPLSCARSISCFHQIIPYPKLSRHHVVPHPSRSRLRNGSISKKTILQETRYLNFGSHKARCGCRVYFGLQTAHLTILHLPVCFRAVSLPTTATTNNDAENGGSAAQVRAIAIFLGITGC